MTYVQQHQAEQQTRQSTRERRVNPDEDRRYYQAIVDLSKTLQSLDSIPLSRKEERIRQQMLELVGLKMMGTRWRRLMRIKAELQEQECRNSAAQPAGAAAAAE
jgi:hypothetical protein